MKTIVKEQKKSYSNPIIERMVEELGQKGIALASSTAKLNALSLNPPLSGYSLKMAIEFLTNHFNTLLADVNRNVNGPLQLQLGAMERTNISEKQLVVQRDIIKQESLLSASSKKESEKSFILVTLSTILFFTLILGLISGELAFLVHSLQVITPNYQSAINLAISIVISVGLIGHFGDVIIRRIFKDLIIRKIARICLVLFIATIFIAMGILRQQYLYLKQSLIIEDSLWYFVGINFLLFGALYLISELIMPIVIEDFKEMIKFLRTQNKFKKIKTKIKNLETELEASKEELFLSLTDKVRITSFHKDMESLVDRYYKQSVSMYKQVNIDVRLDGIPEYFNESPPELDFFTNKIPL